jgi:N-acetylglucosaminyl-diphospho-decaprenol L-rhamnosyltransferase
MFNPEVAIIINSLNRLDLLKNCLHALYGWIPGSEFNGKCVIVIYDAGSKDGTIEWLQNTIPAIPLELILPKPGDDTSFSAGLNKGVEYISTKYASISYLLFYETDNQILAPEPFLQALNQLKEKKELAACGFTVRQHNGSPAGVGQPFPALGNFLLGKNIVYKFQLEAVHYNWQPTADGTAFSEVDVVYTSPLLVKMEAWKASGGLDAKVFPFSDCDVDWARRLRKLGWRIGVIRTNAVIHDNQQAISAWSKSRAIQYHRGRLRYFKRHHPVAVFTVWPVLLLLRHLLELTAAKLMVKEPSRRSQLTAQFSTLLKSCYRSYE